MVVSGSPERRGLASGAGAPGLGPGCQSVHGTDGLLPAHHLGPHRGAYAPTPFLPPPLRLGQLVPAACPSVSPTPSPLFRGAWSGCMVHIMWFGVWLVLNTGRVGVRPFDEESIDQDRRNAREHGYSVEHVHLMARSCGSLHARARHRSSGPSSARADRSRCPVVRTRVDRTHRRCAHQRLSHHPDTPARAWLGLVLQEKAKDVRFAVWGYPRGRHDLFVASVLRPLAREGSVQCARAHAAPLPD